MEYIRVNDEFVQLRLPAVLKCRFQSGKLATITINQRQQQFDLQRPVPFLQGLDVEGHDLVDDLQPQQQHRQLTIEWFTSDGYQVSAREPVKAGDKLVAFESGELHVNNVEMNDLRRTYGCRLRNLTSRRVITSSNLAQLILVEQADEQQQQQQMMMSRPPTPLDYLIRQPPPPEVVQSADQVQVLHTADQIVALDANLPQWPGGNLMDQVSQRFVGGLYDASAFERQNGGNTRRPPLMLPCAVRLPQDKLAKQTRWLYQAPQQQQQQLQETDIGSSQAATGQARPVTLDQLANVHSKWLQLIEPTRNGPGASMSQSKFEQQQMHQSDLHKSKLIVGPTYLAIERPTARLSGRYMLQLLPLAGADEQQAAGTGRILCDINVIVRQPIKLRLAPVYSSRRRPRTLARRHTAGTGERPRSNDLPPPPHQSQPAESSSGDSLIKRLVASVTSVIEKWSAGSDQEDTAEAHRGEPNNILKQKWRRQVSGGGGSASLQPSGQLQWNSYENALEAGELDEAQDLQAPSGSTPATSPLIDDDLTRVRVRGPGSVPSVPIVRIGDRLELECTGSGYPIDTLRWFRQGQVINTQSSSDFQTELSTVYVSWHTNHLKQQQYHSMHAVNQSGAAAAGTAARPRTINGSQRGAQMPIKTVVSRLLIRQLQPRDAGLVMFECFAENSHGDRARSSLAIYVADREQVDEARSKCPLEAVARMPANATVSTSPYFRWASAAAQVPSSFLKPKDDDDDNESDSAIKRVFRRENPFKTALVLEGEFVELECPVASAAGLELGLASDSSGANGGQQRAGGGAWAQKTISEQIDWFKWWPSGAGLERETKQRDQTQMDQSDRDQMLASSAAEVGGDDDNDNASDGTGDASGLNLKANLVQQGQSGAGGPTSRLLLLQQFNQLFAGESRFVMNGSSLQIRSPSKRHDETLFVCLRRPQPGGSGQQQRQQKRRQAREAWGRVDRRLASQEAAVPAADVDLADGFSSPFEQDLEYANAVDAGQLGLEEEQEQLEQEERVGSGESLVRKRRQLTAGMLLANFAGPAESVHQSSLASATCLDALFAPLASTADSPLEAKLQQHEQQQQQQQEQKQQQQGLLLSGSDTGGRGGFISAGGSSAPSSGGGGKFATSPPLVSSISIKIVAKPRIDPFEFSRNLEEGMRTVVVCTVISGQSLVDINWFKDGKLLIGGDESNEISIDYANGFSSTLTFHKIRSSHSGYYTCIASNAIAAAEHTSRLLVNVAPYFIEPPKNQRVYLNSNVIINCRAGGQPSPQIRWRKLVPIGGTTGGISEPSSGPTARQQLQSVAPLGGLQTSNGNGNNNNNGPRSAFESLMSTFNDYDISAASRQVPQLASQQQRQQHQQAQVPVKQEFRIITSNSHIQVLENGSMIIRNVELGDASRYSCQASNGVQPISSEIIDLQVLQPAQFDINYETISVKRDSLIRFSCVPRGDQPIKIEWFKEGIRLVPPNELSQHHQHWPIGSSSSNRLLTNQSATTATTSELGSSASQPALGHSFKYSESVHSFNLGALTGTGGPSANVAKHAAGGSGISSAAANGAKQAAILNATTGTGSTIEHRQLVLDLDSSSFGAGPGGMTSPTSVSQPQQTATTTIQGTKSNQNANQQFGKPVVAAPAMQQQQAGELHSLGTGMISSELIISSADRSDTGLFVCRARNVYGSDELTYRLVVQEPPDAPFNLQLQSVLSQSLKLLWQTPFDGNIPITHFVIEYKRLYTSGVSPVSTSIGATTTGSGASASSNNIMTTNRDGGGALIASYSPVVSSLSSSALSSGGGDWMRLVVSNEQATIASNRIAPVNEMNSPGSATVAHGEDRLHHRAHDSGPVVKSASGLSGTLNQAPGSQSPAAINSVTIEHLSAKSTYQIRVAAVNPIGQGLFSPIHLITTAEEAPQARASSLRAQPLSSQAIKLTWTGPLPYGPDDPAPIRGYHVSYRHALGPNGSSGQTALSSSSSEPATSSWLATLTISASNYTATGSGPGAIVSNNLIINKQAHEGNMGASASQLQPVPETLASYELVLQALDRNTKYELRVQPFNSMGVGPASQLLAQTLSFDRPGQPALKLVAARKQSLELKWSMPSPTTPTLSSSSPAATSSPTGQSGASSELLGFSLYYKTEFDDWQEIQLALIYHYIIEGLRCGNKYQIYLSAFNSVGRSDPSEVLSVRTEGTTPIAPDKSQFFKLNTTEVTLDMGQWSSGGCQITSFMIQYKRLHDTNWFMLSEESAPFTQTDRVTIPDLAPATWYKLLVTALNEAGSTNAEYIFSTLTIDGQQLETPSYLVEQHRNSDQLQTSRDAYGYSSRQPFKAIGSFFAYLSQALSPFGPPSNGGESPQSPASVPPAGTKFSHQHQFQHQDAQLLFWVSCVLLMLVTLLASYLYYNRSIKPNQQMRLQQKCHNNNNSNGKNNNNNSTTSESVHCNGSGPDGQARSSRAAQLQLIDRHLLHAHCVGGTNTTGDSSSLSSSSAASMHQNQQQQQHNHHQQHYNPYQQQQQLGSSNLTGQVPVTAMGPSSDEKQLIQSNGLQLLASKSQLLPLDASQPHYQTGMDQFTSHSSPRSENEQQLQHQSALGSAVGGGADQYPVASLGSANTNYVLDTFLDQQVQAPCSGANGGVGLGSGTLTSSFVCPVGSSPLSSSATLQHGRHSGATSQCRTATMKLFANTHRGPPSSIRSSNASYCFNGPASSSISSSGLGSAQTSSACTNGSNGPSSLGTGGQHNPQVHHHQQQAAVAVAASAALPNGFELNYDLDGAQQHVSPTAGRRQQLYPAHVELIQQQQQQPQQQQQQQQRSEDENQHFHQTLLAQLFAQDHDQDRNSSANINGAANYPVEPISSHQRSLLASSSFASAADLLARQERQQHTASSGPSNGGEPIYQQLDKFKTCAVPTCRQFATLNPKLASKIKQNFLRNQEQQQQLRQCSFDDQFIFAAGHAQQATTAFDDESHNFANGQQSLETGQRELETCAHTSSAGVPYNSTSSFFVPPAPIGPESYSHHHHQQASLIEGDTTNTTANSNEQQHQHLSDLIHAAGMASTAGGYLQSHRDD